MCHLSSASCNRRKHNAPPIQVRAAVAWQALSFREVLAMINVRKTQEALAKAGYAPGPLDGNWGPSTCTALLAQQAQRQPDAMLRALGRAAAAELPRHGIIDSPARLAEWLAQTGNETGGYTRFEENLRYSARRLLEIWPSRFKTLAQAMPYAWDPTDPDRETWPWPTRSMATAWATRPMGLTTTMAGISAAAG
jgi:hypothetical protein